MGRRKRLPSESHGDLVRRAAAGDQAAWEELVARFGPLLRRVASGGGVTQSDAADVVQATWLRLVEHIDEIRDPDRIPAWLATTAQREVIRKATDSRRQIPCDEVPEKDPVGYADDEADYPVDRGRARFALELALQRLTPRNRELIGALMAERQPDYRDVARRVGIAVGSIGPTRQRCLEKLRRAPELAAAR